jgi:hypothetical protein
MNGLLDGFKVGYGLMDNHYNRKDAREFRDQQYADQQQRYADSQARLAQQDQRQSRIDKQKENEHVLRMTGLAQSNQLNQKDLDNYDEVQKLNMQSDRLAIEAQQQKIDDNERKIKKEREDQAFAELMNMVEAKSKNFRPDMKRFFELSKELEGTQRNFLSNEILQRTIDQFTADMEAGRGLSKDLLNFANNGGIPEIKAAIGKMGRYGSPIADVELVNAEIDETGENVRAALIVTDENGDQYSSFVNEDRDATSPIKNINLDTIIKHYAGQKFVLDEARTNGLLDDINNYRISLQQKSALKPTVLQQNAQYIASIYGEDAARQYTLFGKIQDPQKRQDAINKWAYEQAANQDLNFNNLPPIEQKKRIANILNTLNNLSDQNLSPSHQNLSPAQVEALGILNQAYR